VKPAFDPSDRRRRDMRLLRAVIVVLVALAFYAALAWPLRHSITDDTYIHLVYAKHFRDGQGLVFNPGQGVYGTTSPLWSLGLGVLGKTGIDLLALAHVLALLFGALTILATALFLRRFMDSWVTSQGYGSGRAELAWALAVIAFGADAWLVRWSATGMETALAAFLVTMGFAAYVGRRPWGNRVLVPAAWWAVWWRWRRRGCGAGCPAMAAVRPAAWPRSRVRPAGSTITVVPSSPAPTPASPDRLR